MTLDTRKREFLSKRFFLFFVYCLFVSGAIWYLIVLMWFNELSNYYRQITWMMMETLPRCRWIYLEYTMHASGFRFPLPIRSRLSHTPSFCVSRLRREKTNQNDKERILSNSCIVIYACRRQSTRRIIFFFHSLFPRLEGAIIRVNKNTIFVGKIKGSTTTILSH